RSRRRWEAPAPRSPPAGRRALRLSSFGRAGQVRGSRFIDQPGQGAVRRPDQLRRELLRILWAVEHLGKAFRLSSASDQEGDVARGVDQRRGKGKADRIQLLDLVLGNEPVGDRKRRRTGEER